MTDEEGTLWAGLLLEAEVGVTIMRAGVDASGRQRYTRLPFAQVRRNLLKRAEREGRPPGEIQSLKVYLEVYVRPKWGAY